MSTQPTFYTDGDSPRRDATRLIVLNKILGAILQGGGGAGNFSQGTVNPTLPPNNPAFPAYYTNLTSHTIFTWNVTTHAWQ